MSPAAILFLLRLLSAAALLAFLGVLFWFLYADLRTARLTSAGQAATFGSLRVLANRTATPPVNSVLELAPVTTIGRHNRNTIVLDDAYTSAEHALLSWRDGHWWLEDLGSRNGTLLNDVPFTDPVVISAGDVIAIGEVRFKLELPGMREEKEEREESGIRDSNP